MKVNKSIAAVVLAISVSFGLASCGEPISGYVVGKQYQPYVDNEDAHYEYGYCYQTKPDGTSSYGYGWCYDSGVPDTQECYRLTVERDPDEKGKRKKAKTCVDQATYENTDIGERYEEGDV